MKKISLMMMALLAAMTMSANKFTKVTSAPEDWSGVYLVAYTSDSCAYVFNGKDAANGYVKANPVSGVITSNDLDGYVVEIAKMTGGYSVKWYATGKYMAGESGSNKLNFQEDPAANTINFYTADSVDIISNTSYLTFNTTSNAMRYRYYKAKTVSDNKNIYKHLSLYKADSKPETWTPDTISVSKTIEIIRDSLRTPKGELLMEKSHYIKGVVATAPTDPGSYGNTIFWMTDIDAPNDSIQAYKIYGKNGAKIATIDDIPFVLGDTIMIKADALMLYTEEATGKKKYEATPGAYVETLGKASYIDANSIFKYPVGALQCGLAYDSVRYKYEMIFSRVSVEEPENALHMIINTTKEKGIDGNYTVKNYQKDSSFIDGEGPVGGTLKITYISAGEDQYNSYRVVANFSCGAKKYRMDTTFNLSGWTPGFENEFKLEDDVPYVPKEGDTITCAQALSYAIGLGSDTSTITVYVKGYAVGFQSITGREQQSVKMADTKDGTSTFVAYLCYTQGLDSIIKGDEVLVKGRIAYYSPVAQIKKGGIFRIGGSDTKRKRTIECVDRPKDYITVVQALEIGNNLVCPQDSTVSTEEEYTVVGYIVSVKKQTSSGFATWYMSDTLGAYGDFEAYKCEISNLIDVDDYVYATGKISKYVSADGTKTTIEISKGVADFVCDPSDIEEVAEAVKKVSANKVLVNGQLYIKQGDVLYNAQGVIVK